MSPTATATPSVGAHPTIKRPHPETVAAWILGFAPTTYLALSGGGYDIIARSELGLLAWWFVLLGLLVGVLPRRRLSAGAWTALILLSAFLAWTWIAVGWTESKEQTLAEVARVATYLGALTVGLMLSSRRALAPLLFGLACAVGLVSGLAVLSWLVPSWFPANTSATFYATSRLSYPFDYSDGVGEFAALGLPLLLFVSAAARTAAARILGAAALPVIVICLALTASRGGVLAGVVALVTFLAIAPGRARLIVRLFVVAIASIGPLIKLAQLPVSSVSLQGQSAGQRHSILVLVILACVGAGILELCLTIVSRRTARFKRFTITHRVFLTVTAAALTAVTAGVVLLVATGTDNRLWQEFKQPNPPAAGSHYFRVLSLAGSHRYQYWRAALDAFEAHPWRGIGPGTFQFYWAQHNSLGEFVRNAHSLWFETLAELGIIGITLIGAFFAFALIGGFVRARRASLSSRLVMATAVAGTAAFCAAAAFDWVWQIGVMPLIAMFFVAAAFGGDGERERRVAGRLGLGTRVGLGLAAVVASWAIAVPLVSTIEVRASQAAAGEGHFRTALADAATAQNIEPDAASPRLQRALILEQLGDIGGASVAVGEAEARESTNWRIWLIASRIAIEADRPRLALADYERARALNPSSPIFRVARQRRLRPHHGVR